MVAPFDALLIANRLNLKGPGVCSCDDGEGQSERFYYDVNGNGSIDGFDVLRIVNRLNGGRVVVPTSLTAPESAVSGQPVEISLATGLEGRASYLFDWNNDGKVEETREDSAVGMSIIHVFPHVGVQRFRVQVIGLDESFEGSAHGLVTVHPVLLQRRDLLVGGTLGPDQIFFRESSAQQVTVELNGQIWGAFSGVNRITAYGQAGNDHIETSSLRIIARLHGGPGDDLLVGGAESDELYGGDDSDTLEGGMGADLLEGGDGRDRLFGQQDVDLLFGGRGDDLLDGGDGNDILEGDSGNDRLVGGAGDDKLSGGDGNDDLNGDSGSDALFGDDGEDSLRGDAGGDVLVGGAGGDTLLGLGGRDILIGGEGPDRLDGSDDDDILVGGPTVFDADRPSLTVLLDQWSSAIDYDQRVAMMRDAVPGLKRATVFQNDAADDINGGAGQDWFFGTRSDVSDHTTAEVFTHLGSNRALTTETTVQHMPSVAINPRNRLHIVVAYMDYSLGDEGYAGIGISYSRDGAKTWNRSVIAVPQPFDQGAANPIAVFDERGRVFVSFMAATFLHDKPPLTDSDAINPETGTSYRALGFRSHNGIFVARSDDGGARWNTPIAVTARQFFDKEVVFDTAPSMTIDLTATLVPDQSNPHFQNLYVTWTRFYPPSRFPGESNSTGGGEIMFAVSRDGGSSWAIQTETRRGVERSVVAMDEADTNSGTGLGPGTSLIDGANVTVGKRGEIYVSYSVRGAFAVSVSHTAGREFSAPNARTGRQYVFGTVPLSPAIASDGPATASRRLVADLGRPGNVYAVDVLGTMDHQGNQADPGEVYFSSSSDFGLTWQTVALTAASSQQSPSTTTPLPLNDDNGSRSSVTNSPREVRSKQAVAQIAADEEGRLAVVWYDTRRDPNGVEFEVFGTVSNDGGRTFSPNFRLSDESLDAEQGAFSNARGQRELHFGDSIGLALSELGAYVAWTDMRDGNQNVYFESFPVATPFPPLNDRLEPNDRLDDPSSPTEVGPVFQRLLPKLTLAPGEDDLFIVEAMTDGDFFVSADFDAALPESEAVWIELLDDTGRTVLATGNERRDHRERVVASEMRFASETGRQYLVGVTGVNQHPVPYSLSLWSLTADLGTRVHAGVDGDLTPGDGQLYMFEAAVSGSIEIELTSQSGNSNNLRLELLHPRSHEVSSRTTVRSDVGGVQQLDSPALEGDRFIVQVATAANDPVDFALTLTNSDFFTASGTKTLFYPVPGGPTQASLTDIDSDGDLDAVVISGQDDIISVLSGDSGIFQSPRPFAIGAFLSAETPRIDGVPNFGRNLAFADFNQDDVVDIVATNSASSDISLLLGRGDATLQPQRRFDAASPFDLATGDVNGDGHVDVVTIDTATSFTEQVISTLLGRGDGTFRVPRESRVPIQGVNSGALRLADVNEDGNLDVVSSGDEQKNLVAISLGRGDGSFQHVANVQGGFQSVALAVGDMNHDGHTDIVSVDSAGEENRGYLLLGNGDGTFRNPIVFLNSDTALATEIADIGGLKELSDGSLGWGPADGVPDILVANVADQAGLARSTVVAFPGLVNEQGHFQGVGSARLLTDAVSVPMDLEVAHLNDDNLLDVVVVDRDSIVAVLGGSPEALLNTTPESARPLGTVIHFLGTTESIVPGRESAYYRFSTPVELVGDRDHVIDVALHFEHPEGPGLRAELRDASNRVVGAGERFRAVVPQGEALTLHVFGRQELDGAHGFGAFTPEIIVLPQIADVESLALLPGVDEKAGGPTTNVVLTIQGNRLDRHSAQDPANTVVIHAGSDGRFDTNDDTVIPVSDIVYSSDTNFDVSSGRTFPSRVRQTLNLLFAEGLPPGAYRFELSDKIQAIPFDGGRAEIDLPARPLVSVDNGVVHEGSRFEEIDLIMASGVLGDLTIFSKGTPFLTQLHGDLSAVLDATLTEVGDAAEVSNVITDHLRARLDSAVGLPEQRETALLAIWLDPVSIDFEFEDDESIKYDQDEQEVIFDAEKCFIEVGGNIEIILCAVDDPQVSVSSLTVAHVPKTARGGTVVIDRERSAVRILTPRLRADVTDFTVEFEKPVVRVPEGNRASNTGSFEIVGDDAIIDFSASIGEVIDTGKSTWSWSFNTMSGPQQSQTVQIFSTTGDGNVHTHTFELVVENVPPLISLAAIEVRTIVRMSASNTITVLDAGNDDLMLSASLGELTALGGGSWRWVSEEPLKNETILITATDSDGATSSASFELIVANSSPQITPSSATVRVREGMRAITTGSYSEAENQGVSLSTSVGEIVDNRDGTWRWQWDGATDGPDDSRSVTVTATDDTGLSTSVMFDLIVENSPPTLSFDKLLVKTAEATSAANTGTYTDAGEDTVELTVSLGEISAEDDGSWSWFLSASDLPSENTLVHVTARDSDGAAATFSFNLLISNVSPTVVADQAQITVREGEIASNTGSFFDQGNDAVVVTASVGEILQQGNAWSWSFQTQDGPADSRTVIITATDSDGGMGQVTFDLVVTNVAPTVTVDVSTVQGLEGQTVTNQGKFADVGNDTVSLSASIGKVVNKGDGNWTWSFDSTDGPDESQIVTIKATDDDGASGHAQFNLQVENVAPTVNISGPATIGEGQEYRLTFGDVVDPGDDRVTQFVVNWGDNHVEAFSSSANVTHNYADGPESVIISVSLVDEDGNHPIAATVAVDIENLAPQLSVAKLTVTVTRDDNRETATNSGTFFDPGDDIVTLSASSGTITQQGTRKGSWTWRDVASVSKTVVITAIDSDGLEHGLFFELVVI